MDVDLDAECAGLVVAVVADWARGRSDPSSGRLGLPRRVRSGPCFGIPSGLAAEPVRQVGRRPDCRGSRPEEADATMCGQACATTDDRSNRRFERIWSSP
jgi:hypothetical protein